MGSRGASLDLSDGPRGGSGGGKKKYGQPNTPQMRPVPNNVEQVLGGKGRPISAEEAARSVNPDRNAVDAMDYADYTENCQRCVIAYELNRRGYNVEAEATHSKDTYPMGQNYLKAFKNAVSVPVGASTAKKASQNAVNFLKARGDGTRAIVQVAYNSREGHVFNAEYKGGRIYYYDAQTGQRYNPKTVFNHVRSDSVVMTQVNHLDIGQDVVNMVRKKRPKK